MLAFVSANLSATIPEMAKALNLTENGVNYHLRRLQQGPTYHKRSMRPFLTGGGCFPEKGAEIVADACTGLSYRHRRLCLSLGQTGSVNSQMIIAYWLIEREIVQELQAGEERAGYEDKLLSGLSKSLNDRYGKGFSVTKSRYFRLFYQTYSDREPQIHHKACDVLDDLSLAVERSEAIKGFSPALSWSRFSKTSN